MDCPAICPVLVVLHRQIPPSVAKEERQGPPCVQGVPKAQPKRHCAEHPTMKPVELFAYQIRNSARRGGIVLDPFSGSWTTVIAAELTGRRGRAVEMDPRYADVIRKRWAEMVHGEGCDWQSLTPPACGKSLSSPLRGMHQLCHCTKNPCPLLSAVVNCGDGRCDLKIRQLRSGKALPDSWTR